MTQLIQLDLSGDLSIDDWSQRGDTLSAGLRQINWMMGDWLVYGIDKFGAEAQTIASQKFGRSPTELKKALDVAKRFPPELRRPELSFTHYQHLMTLPDEQAFPLIDTAITDSLTAKETGKRVASIRESEGGEVFDAIRRVDPIQANDDWYSAMCRQWNRAPSVECHTDFLETLADTQPGDLMEP